MIRVSVTQRFYDPAAYAEQKTALEADESATGLVTDDEALMLAFDVYDTE